MKKLWLMLLCALLTIIIAYLFYLHRSILQLNNENFLDISMGNKKIINGYPEPPDKQIFNQQCESDQTTNYITYDNVYNLKFRDNLDKIYNPLRYPLQSNYWDINGLPPQVYSCGSRREPCTEPVRNLYPLDISNRNIAPITAYNFSGVSREPDDVPQQVGVIHKVFGNLNEVYPLFGIRKYRNGDTWYYYTKIGKDGNYVKLPVKTRKPTNNELGTNDDVMVTGNSEIFKVTIYDTDYPI